MRTKCCSYRYVPAANTLFVGQRLERAASRFVDAGGQLRADTREFQAIREQLRHWDSDLSIPLPALMIWRRQAASDKSLNAHDLRRIRLMVGRDIALGELKSLVKGFKSDLAHVASAVKSGVSFLSPTTARDQWKTVRSAGSNLSRSLGRWLLASEINEEAMQPSESVEREATRHSTCRGGGAGSPVLPVGKCHSY